MRPPVLGTPDLLLRGQRVNARMAPGFRASSAPSFGISLAISPAISVAVADRDTREIRGAGEQPHQNRSPPVGAALFSGGVSLSSEKSVGS